MKYKILIDDPGPDEPLEAGSYLEFDTDETPVLYTVKSYASMGVEEMFNNSVRTFKSLSELIDDAKLNNYRVLASAFKAEDWVAVDDVGNRAVVRVAEFVFYTD